MRRIITIAAACMLLLQATTCKKEVKGKIDVRGYVMEQCGSDVPERYAKVSFGIGSTELLSTTTDANGYFHLKGEYEMDVCTTCEYDDNYLAFQGDGASSGGFYRKEFACNLPEKVNIDTAYMDNSMNAQFEIYTDGQTVGSELDTLYIHAALPYYKRTAEKNYELIKIPGPFTDGMVSDTVLVYAPRHAGFLCNYIHAENNNKEFLYGFAVNPYDPKYAFAIFSSSQKNETCNRFKSIIIDLTQ